MPDVFKDRYVKFYSGNDTSLTINVVPGHFATSQSHVNYYVDVTRMKVRINEAENAARAIRNKIRHHVTEIDTIVCLDETDMLGGALGHELEKGDEFITSNLHETIYVVHPEILTGNQLSFRDNNKLAIEGKKILILTASLTTGATLAKALEAIPYFGGTVAGVVSIFSTHETLHGFPIYSLFSQSDIPNYEVFAPTQCPYCAKKIPIEALVSGSGYLKL